MESPNTSPQAVELNTSCSGQASQQAWHRSRAQNHGAWKHFHNTPFSICSLSIQKRGCQVWQGCPKDSAHLAQTGIWILVSIGEYLRTHLKDHTKYDRGPEIHGESRRVSLPFGKAQLAGCLRVQVGGSLEWDAGTSNYAQGVIQDTVDEASVSTATPDWRTVLGCTQINIASHISLKKKRAMNMVFRDGTKHIHFWHGESLSYSIVANSSP